MQRHAGEKRGFPIGAGVLLGAGLGGFFDGIVLHQVLQWHHLVSDAGYPPDTVENLRINVFADGVFHLGTYVFVVLGIALMWRSARQTHLPWEVRSLAGSLLIGFGGFNVVEGVINHHLLGIHHVNETVPADQWLVWDIGFLVWGAVMLGVGIWLVRKRRA